MHSCGSDSMVCRVKLQSLASDEKWAVEAASEAGSAVVTMLNQLFFKRLFCKSEAFGLITAIAVRNLISMAPRL